MDTQRYQGTSLMSGAGGAAPQGVELRHLRYFVAVADAGTFTHAAESMYIAQPTLSQQIRRLEEMVGAPLLRRSRDGVRPTEAGMVLLEESRTVLSLVDHGVSRTRQAAGIGRPRLRFVVPPYLPEMLAVETASALRSTAGSGVDVIWLEVPLDAEFSVIRQHRADAGLGWIDPDAAALPASLEVMNLGEYEPVAWIPATHPSAADGVIALGELAGMDIVPGPRRAGGGTYDAWLTVLRSVNPRFAFTDPPFRHSLPMTLAFAATGNRAIGVLTGPCRRVGDEVQAGSYAGVDTYDMVPVRVEAHALTAAAGLVWNGDLPRELQQVLIDTAMASLFSDYRKPQDRLAPA